MRSGSRAASETDNDGVILAATSGAVNVRLGEALKAVARARRASRPAARQRPSHRQHTGASRELAHLRSVVGLVWRSVVLWMVLLALLTLARLLG